MLASQEQMKGYNLQIYLKFVRKKNKKSKVNCEIVECFGPLVRAFQSNVKVERAFHVHSGNTL